jgi:protein arginine kinase
MSFLRELARRPTPWLTQGGSDGDIVLSSRVRLARNLAGKVFPHAVAAAELRLQLEETLAAVAGLPELAGSQLWRMEELDELERRFLLERHLISVDLVRNLPGRAVLASADESEGIMLHEEDHLRLQSFAAGLDPKAALRRVERLVAALARNLTFAWSPRLGYLTACPTNVGTGMRASLLVHLPGLTLTGDIEKVLNSLRRLNLTVRGFYGEGSGVMGSLYQISNSITLGCQEAAIVADLLAHGRKVIACERAARGAALERDRVRLADRAWRAHALLAQARLLSTREAFDLLSDLRLGASLGLLQGVDESLLNVLLMNVQSAHLQVAHGRAMTAAERDEARATYVRGELSRHSPHEPKSDPMSDRNDRKDDR